MRQYLLLFLFLIQILSADSFEPNNDFQSARVLPLNETVKIEIDPVGDRDFFKLKIPASGNLQIFLNKDPDNPVDPEFVFYDEQKKKVGTQGLQKGEYYVGVYDGWDNDASTHPVYLTAYFFSREIAEKDRVPLPYVEEIVFSDLSPRRIVFKIETPSYLQFSLFYDDELLSQVQAFFYDEEGNRIKFDPQQIFPPGTYHLIVFPERVRRTDASLTVDLSAFPSLDPFEPNDTMSQASLVKEFPFESLVQLDPLPEQDWFRLEVPDAGILSVYVQPTFGYSLTPQFAIFDREGKVLFQTTDQWGYMGSRYVEVDPEKNPYYVKVYSDWRGLATIKFDLYPPTKDTDDAIRFVALDLSETTVDFSQLSLITQSIGEELVNVESVDEIAEELNRAVEKKGNFWIYLLIVLVIGGGGAFYWWRRKRKATDDLESKT